MARRVLARSPATRRARLRARPARCSPRSSAFRGQGSGRAWALTLFYFMAFGGFVAMFLYLPKLLTDVHDLTKTDAGARAAGFALLAVVARPIGGWLSDRIGAERVLRASFVGTAAARARARGLLRGHGAADDRLPDAGGLPRPRHRRRVQAGRPSGSRPQVGAVTGVVGAAGGLGGFFPPLVMALVKSATGSYTLGFVLMAAVAALAAARAPRAAPRDGPRRTATPAPADRRDARGGAPMSDGRALLRARQFFGPRDRSADGWNERLDLRPRLGVAPTGAAGSTTASSARPTASTAPARARGRSTSRTGSSPGRPSRPTTPRTAPTRPTTSRAAARAAPRSPGTSTRRCGPSTPTCAGVLLEMFREARERLGDPVEAWAVDRRRPRARARLQVAARQGRLRARAAGTRSPS